MSAPAIFDICVNIIPSDGFKEGMRSPTQLERMGDFFCKKRGCLVEWGGDA